jgi:hypothetical protein
MTSRVERHRHPNELPADALALLDAAERDNLEFGRAWWANFIDQVCTPADHATLLRLADSAGRTLALLPLLERASWLPGWRRHEALGNYYTTLYAPIMAPSVTAGDLEPLLAALRGARSVGLCLQPLDTEAPAARALRDALRAGGWRLYESVAFGNWFLRVEGDWEAYLRSRTAGLRSTLKRMDKKFVQDGGRYQILRTPDEVAQAVAAYGQVYASSWKRPEPYPGFIPGLATACAERGWLRMGVLWLGEQPIAAQLWMVAHGRAAIYKVAYDEAHKAYSPGSLLTGHLMRHVIEVDGVTEVDYLMGDDGYKKQWMGERRERWCIEAYHPRSVGGALTIARKRAGAALRTLRGRG